MTKNKRDRRLGQGLAALLGGIDAPEDSGQEPSASSSAAGSDFLGTAPLAAPVEENTKSVPFHSDSASGAVEDAGKNELLEIPIEQIEPNPFQPRREFGEEEIESLAASLDSHQMLQPVLVRPYRDGDQMLLYLPHF